MAVAALVLDGMVDDAVAVTCYRPFHEFHRIGDSSDTVEDGSHSGRRESDPGDWRDTSRREEVDMGKVAFGIGNLGGPLPAPESSTVVWVVALQARFPQRTPTGGGAAVVVIDAQRGSVILVMTGPWNWPPFWDNIQDLDAVVAP